MRLLFTISACFFFVSPALCQVTYYPPFVTKTVINNGVGLGAIIAVVTSWSRNRSVLWAILHGVLGWLYVIYYVITRDQSEEEL